MYYDETFEYVYIILRQSIVMVKHVYSKRNNI